MEILWADECSAGSATIAQGVELLMLIRDIRVWLRSWWLLWLSTAWTASPCFAFSLRCSGARGRLCGYAALHLSPQTLHDCVQSWTNLRYYRYYRWALSTMSLLRTFHCSSFSTPFLTFSWYPMISYDIHEYLLESIRIYDLWCTPLHVSIDHADPDWILQMRILPEFQRHLGTHALPFKATDERQSLERLKWKPLKNQFWSNAAQILNISCLRIILTLFPVFDAFCVCYDARPVQHQVHCFLNAACLASACMSQAQRATQDRWRRHSASQISGRPRSSRSNMEHR